MLDPRAAEQLARKGIAVRAGLRPHRGGAERRDARATTSDAGTVGRPVPARRRRPARRRARGARREAPESCSCAGQPSSPATSATRRRPRRRSSGRGCAPATSSRATVRGASASSTGSRTSCDPAASRSRRIEVELALLEHPAVADAAVAGVPDERWGEELVAWVVLAEPVDGEALRAHLDGRLADFKHPEALPRRRRHPAHDERQAAAPRAHRAPSRPQRAEAR